LGILITFLKYTTAVCFNNFEILYKNIII